MHVAARNAAVVALIVSLIGAGNQEKSNREGFVYWNGERMYGVKWQNFKLVLVDPANLHYWTMAHFGRLLGEFQKSVAREPLIPAGAELDRVP